MKRLQNVQGLRAIAAALVVFVHLGGPGGFTATTLSGQDPFWILHPIGNTGVDVFFAISGLIMIVTTSRVEHDARSAWVFLRRRAIRIYPPYIAVTLILFAPTLLHPDVMASLPGLVKSLALWPMAQLPVLFVGWTLTYEMYFYLVFAVTILLPARHQLVVLGAWGTVTVAVALTAAGASPLLGLVGGPLNLEFLFGVGVGKALLAGRLRFPVTSTVLGVAAVLSTYLLLLGPGQDVPNAWVRIAGVGAPSALILYGVLGLEHAGTRLPRFVNGLGDYSYALYLVHPLVLQLSGPLVRRLPPTPLDAVLAGLAALVASFAAAVVFRRLVEQPLLMWSQRLTDGRTVARRAPVVAEVAP
jgi:exopolysaccharide production protein ExoZ